MEPDVVEIQRLLADLERLYERCQQGLLYQREVETSLAEIDKHLRAACPQDSSGHRLIEHTLAATEWWGVTQTGYPTSEDCQKILLRVNTVREVLNMISPEFLRAELGEQHQFYFQPGEMYRARQRFFHVLSRAKARVDICDAYLDQEVLDFIDALPETVECRLLTAEPKRLFLSQLKLLQPNRPSLEARLGHRSHDRWVILDGTEVWHLGASINSLGKRAFMLSRVLDSSESARISADFAAWWSSANPV